MPFTIKGEVVFSGVEHGWTESFWFMQPTGDLALANTNFMKPYVAIRSPLLGTECSIKAIKSSVEVDDTGVPILGDSFLEYFGAPGDQTQSAAEEDAALQVVWRDALSQRRKMVFMRGIWDIVEAANGQYQPTNAWTKKFLAYSNFVKQKSLGWYTGNPVQRAVVKTYTQTGSHVSIETDVPFFALNPVSGRFERTRVRIAGFTVAGAQLNGLKVVQPLDTTHAITIENLAVLPQDGNGTITRYTPVFFTAASVEDQKIVTRRVGAPLLVSRGRRRRIKRT